MRNYRGAVGQIGHPAGRPGNHVVQVGDYVIAVSVDAADGAWSSRSGELRWMGPNEDDRSVDVVVVDATDGRFVPELWVAVTLIDPAGAEMGAYRHPFHWHPQIHRYGRNWKLPHSGEYRIRVRIEPPTFARVGFAGGRRYLDCVEVEFSGVDIDLGPVSRATASLPIP
jgi:hypothetical protein